MAGWIGSILYYDPDSEAGKLRERALRLEREAELEARIRQAEEIAKAAAMNSEMRVLLTDDESFALSMERALMDLDEAYRFLGEASMNGGAPGAAEKQRRAEVKQIEAAARLASLGGDGRTLAQHLYERRLLVLGGVAEELIQSALGGGWEALRLTRQLLEAMQTARPSSDGAVLDLAFKSLLERRIFEVLITDDGRGYRSAGSTSEKIQDRYPDETYEKGVDRRTVGEATKRMSQCGWPIEITNKGARIPRAARRRLPRDLVEG
jgi:hypothetical protein